MKESITNAVATLERPATKTGAPAERPAKAGKRPAVRKKAVEPEQSKTVFPEVTAKPEGRKEPKRETVSAIPKRPEADSEKPEGKTEPEAKVAPAKPETDFEKPEDKKHPEAKNVSATPAKPETDSKKSEGKKEPKPEKESASEPVITTNPEAVTGPEHEKPPEPKAAAEKPERKRPVARLKAVPKPEKATEPKATAEPEAKAEPEPVTTTGTASEPENKAAPETEPEPSMETIAEPATKPETETRPEPVIAIEIVPGAKGEPEAKPETEPARESAVKPAVGAIPHASGEIPAVQTPPATAPVCAPMSSLRQMRQEFRQRSQIIREELRNIQNSFISIGFQLHWIRENNMYKVLDYKNVYEYAEKEYGIKKTTCCNFISIIDTFADRDEDGNVIESIADCYRNYSSSQLVAMLGMPEELKQQVTPDMTVKAINKLRKGGEEKPAVKPVAPPATVPAEKPVMKEPAVREPEAKEPVREPAMKEPDAPVKGPDAVAKDAKVAAAGMPEPEGKAQSKEEVPRSEPEDKAQSKGEAPEPEPEAAGGMENAVPESVRDAAEITGAVTEKEQEPNHAAGTKEPPEDTPANTVGTLMEIDSYAFYQSIADKIDAMMRQVFSTNRRMKVRIVCEQG